MKALRKYSDFPALESIRRDMDRFFDDLVPFSWREENGGKMDFWAPNTDMSETDDEYILSVDLPGIPKDEIEVNYQDNRLTISGERRRKEEMKEKEFVRKERYYGKFVRSFTLPAAIKDSEIKAHFEDGVLTVHVPKSEVSKPKTVKIN